MAGFFYTLVDHALGTFHAREYLRALGVFEPLESEISALESTINSVTTTLTLRFASEEFHGFIQRANELASNPRVGHRHGNLHWSELLTDEEREHQQELASLRALIRDVESYSLWCAAANELPDFKELLKSRRKIASYASELSILLEYFEGWLPTSYTSGFENAAPEFFTLTDPLFTERPVLEPDADRDPLEAENVRQMSYEACSLAAAELAARVDLALRPAFSRVGRQALDVLTDQHWQIANELHGRFWAGYETYCAS